MVASHVWDSVCRVIYLFPRCCFSISDLCVIVYDLLLGSMTWWGVLGFWMTAQAETKPWIQNNVAALGFIHQHFSFLFFFFVPTVASEEWSTRFSYKKWVMQQGAKVRDFMTTSKYLARNYSAVSSAYVLLEAVAVIWTFWLHKQRNFFWISCGEKNITLCWCLPGLWLFL